MTFHSKESAHLGHSRFEDGKRRLRRIGAATELFDRKAVTSTSTIHEAPFQPHYAASRSALLGLRRSMAVGLARHRIRVNALSPGWTDTDLLAPGRANQKFVDSTLARTPVRRWAHPDEFAAAVVYLADPTVTFHTGDTLVVDGGHTTF